MKRTPENVVKAHVKQYLEMQGWYVMYHMACMGSMSGMPDKTAIKDGKTIYIECKDPNRGRQSENQKEFQKHIEEHGGTYLLIDDIEKLMDWCEQNGLAEQRRIL